MGIQFNPLTGQFDLVGSGGGGGGTVSSVNGQTGVVQLDAADIPYDNTSSGLTATEVQAAIDELAADVLPTFPDTQLLIGDGTNVPVTSPELTFDINGLAVDNDVAITGAVSASNLTGTNTGDQTITLTGDVTGSGTGSFATTIANSVVTDAKVATGINATKLADGSVTNTEFQYINSVTSNVQDQLNAKANTTLSNIAPTTDVNLNAQKMVNVANPTSAQDVATKSYVDTADTGVLSTVSATYIPLSQKGANNGVATLDAGGKVPVTQLPSSILTYEGTWNASTNTPTLADGVGDAGMVYIVNVPGTQNLGSGSITFAVGDWVIYNGTIWQKSANSDTVTSVNGQMGVVVLDTDDIAEGTALYFTDERAQDAVGNIATSSSKVSLTYDDALNTLTPDIVPASLVDADIASGAAINANKIGNGDVSNTELSYLDGVTSSIQTQIDAKANTTLNNILPIASVSFNTQKIIDVLNPTNPQDVATKSYVDGVATGANTTLSNLTSPTAINQDLILNTGANATIKTTDVTTGTSRSVTVQSGTGTSTGSSGAFNAGTGNGVGGSASANLFTGSSSGGNSGNVNLTTGTASGTRGSIILDGASVSVSNTLIKNVASAVEDTDAANKAYVQSNTNLGKNYIVKNNFEDQLTSGWSLGTTGTLTNGIPTGTPTFGSGASGNLSIATTGTNPVAGTYSLAYISSAATTAGDMLATDALSIDLADRAQVLTFKFYYSVPTNPSNGNFSGTSSNSFGVAVYDVTNSAWLNLAGNFSMTQNAGVGIATGTFQTAVNTASLRFVVYNANASAGAITLNFDRFFLGPQTAPIGAVVTDWVNATVTGTWTNNTTYTAKKARIGDSVYYQVLVSLTGTPNTAALSIDIPETIDTTKLAGGTNSKVSLGTARAIDTGTQSYGLYSVVYQSANRVQTYVSDSTSTYVTQPNNITNNVPFAFGNTDVVEINFTVPVVGWSSNVQMSNDTDTRVVAFRANNSTTTISSTPAKVVWLNVNGDTHGAYNNGTYTVPVTGWYNVAASVYTSSTVTLNQNQQIYIYRNGASIKNTINRYPASATLTQSISVCDEFPFNAGDTIEIYVSTEGTSPTISPSASANTVSINRLSGPATIAATESVNCRYTTAAGQSISNGGADIGVLFGTRDYDSHNAYDGTTTGLYTVPISGKYRVSATVTFAGATYAAGNLIIASVYKNGSAYGYGQVLSVQAAVSVTAASLVTTTVNCNAGDTLQIRVFNNRTAGATTLNTTSTYNHMEIERVGN